MDNLEDPKPGEVWIGNSSIYHERYDKVVVIKAYADSWYGAKRVTVLCIDGTEDDFSYNAFVRGFKRLA